MNVAVAILRLQEGLDCSGILADIDDLILKSPRGRSKSMAPSEFSITGSQPNFSPNPYATANPSETSEFDMDGKNMHGLQSFNVMTLFKSCNRLRE